MVSEVGNSKGSLNIMFGSFNKLADFEGEVKLKI
jgi:hypothetical protein